MKWGLSLSPSPPPPQTRRLGPPPGEEVSGEILMSFLKSPPLKTLELIYDIIIYEVGALFVPQLSPPTRHLILEITTIEDPRIDMIDMI